MTTNHKIPLSIREAFQGKNILAIGTTGFLGKVWLAMLLEQVQSFQKIYILIRGKGSMSGKERFEQIVNTSYVFQKLHENLNGTLEPTLRQKIEIIEGDVNEENLGLTDYWAKQFASKIDVVVNFAGLVDFNPDLREAFDVNVKGAMNVASFTQKCRGKKLVHISTCYVAGVREGSVEEKVYTHESPNGTKLDTTYELTWIESSTKRVEQEFNSEEQISAARKLIKDRGNVHHKEQSENRVTKTLENIKRKKLREAMIKLGKDHAQQLGWTNTYTYTKGLAEIILKQHFPQIELVIFRPSIVESSLQFPFPGWNEGFNTSGPLAYLMKTWFRHLPLTHGNPFDVIPVDFVSRGLTVATAALLNNVHKEVYQCSTSDVNRLTIDQACYFTSESHSEYYKKFGADWKEKVILSRWKTIPSRKDHILSTGNMKKFFKKLQSGLEKSKILKSMFKPIHSWALRSSRNLERTEKLLELFYPFIHDYTHIFWTRSLFAYDIVEPEFRFSIDQIQWESYWKEVHMPGLRKWCFPVIEGKSVEKFQPQKPVSLLIENGNGHVQRRRRPDDEETIPIRPRNLANPEVDEKVPS